jgi:hypothetical protein
VLEVKVKGSPDQDTALLKHWGLTRLILPNEGGDVNVTTFDGIVIDCNAWGTGTCS